MSLLQLPTRQLVQTPSIAEFAYNNTLSALLALHPSLPKRVIIRTSWFIQSATLHPHPFVTLSQTSMSYTNNSDNTLPMLNVNTKLPLIPDDYWLRNSRLEAKFMSRLNSSIWHDLPRNYLINSLDCTKSLHFLAPIPSPSDFQTVSMLYTQFSMSQCWNQQLRIQFPIMFNPHPPNHCWWWTGIQNLRNPWLQDRQLTLCLQTIVSCPLDRVWGHWWRNFLGPCFWAWKCFQTCCGFPLCLSSQAWSSFKSLT